MHPKDNTDPAKVTVSVAEHPDFISEILKTENINEFWAGDNRDTGDYIYTPHDWEITAQVSPSYTDASGFHKGEVGRFRRMPSLATITNYFTIYAHEEGDSTKGLPGAVFIIGYMDGDYGNPFYFDIVTGADGIARFPIYDSRGYIFIKEILPSYGYEFNDSYSTFPDGRIIVDLDDEYEQRIDWSSPKMDYPPGLNIFLTDSQDGNSLADATFEITTQDG